MKKTTTAIVLTLSLGAQSAQPLFAQRRGGVRTGPRGGQAAHVQTPRGSGTAVRSPRGGEAVHTQGPYRSGTAARGPYGGGAVRTQGPYGGAAAARGPSGRTAVSGHNYAYGGRSYARPAWNRNQVTGFQRNFYGYPRWRPYGSTYGLVGPLVGFASLAFLSGALLMGTYEAEQQTVYVYVVDEEGKNVEYRVDSSGNVISKQVVQ